jgi:putative endopeptidase
MRLTILSAVIGLCATVALAQGGNKTPSPATLSPAHFGLENLDPKTDPCVDFYQYACVGWMAANPLPPDEVYWDAAKQLQRRNESILHDVLEKVSLNDPKRSAVQREIGDYYAA